MAGQSKETAALGGLWPKGWPSARYVLTKLVNWVWLLGLWMIRPPICGT